jgi:hypothetical protein
MVRGKHDRSGEIPKMFTPLDPAMREDASERKNPDRL